MHEANVKRFSDHSTPDVKTDRSQAEEKQTGGPEESRTDRHRQRGPSKAGEGGQQSCEHDSWPSSQYAGWTWYQNIQRCSPRRGINIAIFPPENAEEISSTKQTTPVSSSNNHSTLPIDKISTQNNNKHLFHLRLPYFPPQ